MRGLLGFWLLVGSGIAGAQSCPDTAPPWIELEVFASELAEHGPVRRVEVHASGCVEVTYGKFDVRAGKRTLDLRGHEVAELASALAVSGVRGFDARAVRAEIADVQRLRRQLSPSAFDVFTVACADIHRLTIREDGAVHTAAWAGLVPYAQRYREVAALDGFARFAQRLEALGEAGPATAPEDAP